MQLALACHKAGETRWIRKIFKMMKEDFALCGERIDEATYQQMMFHRKEHGGVKSQRAPAVSD